MSRAPSRSRSRAPKSPARRPRREPSRRRPAPAAPAVPAPAWLVRCAPGLSRLLQAELRHRKLLHSGDRVDALWQRNHDLLFLPRLARNPAPGELRLAEDVARCPVYGRYKVTASQMDRLAQALRGAGGGAWRLVVTAEGRHFNRHDLRRHLGRELGARGLKLRDDAARSVFVYCVDQAYYAAIPADRADDAPGRDLRQRERAGSLPPTIAAALAFLGKPRDDDVILDPVCGSGTLLAEAAALAPGAVVHGRDLDRAAIKAARANLPELGNGSLAPGDARALDLAPGRVTLVLANLPFGKQFGDVEDNPALYAELLAELARLAAPSGWRAVLLAADAEPVAAAARATGLSVTRQMAIRVRGEPASILKLEPGAGA